MAATVVFEATTTAYARLGLIRRIWRLLQLPYISLNEKPASDYPIVYRRYIGLQVVLMVGILISIVFAVQWFGRNTWDNVLPRSMADQQALDSSIVAAPGDLSFWGSYKLARIAQSQPEVIVIGTSRGGTFRSEMFRPYRFYNASFTGWTIDQDLEMLERIVKVAKPRVIIFPIDYFMFSEPWVASNLQRTQLFAFDQRYKLSLIRFAIQEAWRSVSIIPLRKLFSPQRFTLRGRAFLGNNAVEFSGFRADGSYLYPETYLATSNIRTAGHQYFINAFAGGEKWDIRQAVPLRRVAALAKQYNLKLIGVGLPILSSVSRFLDRDEAYHSYAGVWRDFEQNAASLLDADQIPYCNLTRDPELTQLDYFVDQVHLGEVATLGAVLRLLNCAGFQEALPKIDRSLLEKQFLAYSQLGNRNLAYDEP